MRHFFLILFLAFGASAFGQMLIVGGFESSGEISAQAVVYVRDSLTREALVGATIRIVSGTDTLIRVAHKSVEYGNVAAKYEHYKRFRKPVELTVSFMGFKTFTKSYAVDGFKGRIQVNMREDEREISAIEIKGNMISMIVRGDTTIYNADAFKTIDGDKIGELLRQLPGIEIKDGEIIANGEKVKRVYVDNQTFFGDDTALALRDMTASNIKNVKVYDEDNPTAKRIGDKNAAKDRVVDIVTKNKPKVIKNISLSALYGTSTQKDYNGKFNPRHNERALVSLNKPSNNVSVSAFNAQNNNPSSVMMSSSPYQSIAPFNDTRVSANYNYRQGDSLKYNISAAFDRKRNNNENSTKIDYFPSEMYAFRQVEQSSYSRQNVDDYSLRVGFTHARKKHMIQVGVDGGYGKQNSVSRSASQDHTDDLIIRQQRDNNSSGDSKNLNANIAYFQGFKEGSRMLLLARTTYSKNDSDGWLIDTTGTPSFQTQLLNRGNGHNASTNVEASYMQSVSELSSLTLRYEFSLQDQLSQQLSIDYLNKPQGVMDTINSHDYTVKSSTNNLSLNYDYRSKDKKTSLMVGVAGNITSIARDETLPYEYSLPRTFRAISPAINFSYRPSLQKRFSVNLISIANDISLEQLRDVIDVNNPTSLRAGNPDLKQPRVFNLSAGYNQTIADKALSWSLSFGGAYVFNSVVSNVIYFSEDTYLDLYKYTALRGSSLSTYDNADEYFNLMVNGSVNKRFESIKTSLRCNFMYAYSQVPFFMDGVARSTNQNSLSCNLSLLPSFSSIFKPELNVSTQIGEFASGPYGKSRYLDMKFNGIVRTLFAEKYFVNAKASYNLYRNSVSKQTANDIIYCNMDVGRKFGKKNNLSAKLGLVDIFNQSKNRTTNVVNDYITTSVSSQLGRYWFVELSQTF